MPFRCAAARRTCILSSDTDRCGRAPCTHPRIRTGNLRFLKPPPPPVGPDGCVRRDSLGRPSRRVATTIAGPRCPATLRERPEACLSRRSGRCLSRNAPTAHYALPGCERTPGLEPGSPRRQRDVLAVGRHPHPRVRPPGPALVLRTHRGSRTLTRRSARGPQPRLSTCSSRWVGVAPRSSVPRLGGLHGRRVRCSRWQGDWGPTGAPSRTRTCTPEGTAT